MKFISAVKKSITHVHFHLILSWDEASILVTEAGNVKAVVIVEETHMDTPTHIKQISRSSRAVFRSKFRTVACDK